VELDSSIPPELIESATHFFSERRAVVVDPSGASRSGIAKTLLSLGLKSRNLTMLGDYTQAAEFVVQSQPTVVVVDFDLGKYCGLSLCQVLRENDVQPHECLFIVVTGNASQTAIAQAAEEEVDAYILKPYTLGQFMRVVVGAAASKLNPGSYGRKINEGKTLLSAHRADEAIQCFAAAVALDPKPSLAHYYQGLAEVEAQRPDVAQASFEAGLQHNSLHYKCLNGLFELYLGQKRHDDAYRIAQKLCAHFPVVPTRLEQVLKLSILTGNYDDIDELYELFKGMDIRSEALSKCCSAAVVIGGKAALKEGKKAKGIELLHKASVSAAGRGGLLKEIVLTFLQHKEIDEAFSSLKRFDATAATSPEYLCAKLAVDNASAPDPGSAIHAARTAIGQGLQDPLAYEILIGRFVEIQKPDEAQEWSEKASKLWPELQEKFRI
jgi:CheY-like chemotaxis protein